METRNWYAVYLLLLTTAFALEWGLANTGEVTAQLPVWIRMFWYGGLVIGSLTAIIGELLFTNFFLLVEQAALYFLTGIIMSFALAFIIQGIRTSSLYHIMYVAVALILFAVVNVNRALQLKRQVRLIYRVYAKLPTMGSV